MKYFSSFQAEVLKQASSVSPDKRLLLTMILTSIHTYTTTYTHATPQLLPSHTKHTRTHYTHYIHRTVTHTLHTCTIHSVSHTHISLSTKCKSTTHAHHTVPHTIVHTHTHTHIYFSHQPDMHIHTSHHTTHICIPHTLIPQTGDFTTHMPHTLYHMHMSSHTKHNIAAPSLPNPNMIWPLATSSPNFQPSLPCLLYLRYTCFPTHFLNTPSTPVFASSVLATEFLPSYPCT